MSPIGRTTSMDLQIFITVDWAEQGIELNTIWVEKRKRLTSQVWWAGCAGFCMPSAKLMHLPTEGWSLTHTSRHDLGVESKSWYFLALVLRLLEHLWFFHTQRGPLVGLYQEHGITPKSGMNLKSCSVLTTVGAVTFGKGHYSSISGSRGVLVLSHPASQVGCLCLCVILPPLIFSILISEISQWRKITTKDNF